MKHTFLRSVILTLSLLIGGSEFLFSSDKSLSTFLFALKSNINPLEISKTRNSLTVDNSSIQNFIDTHDIENIEPWLMGANENDFDGNVYLIGGYDSNCSNINEMYNIDNDSWSTKSSMTYSRNYVKGGVINNKVYLMGGTCGGINSDFTYNEVYDPSMD